MKRSTVVSVLGCMMLAISPLVAQQSKKQAPKDTAVKVTGASGPRTWKKLTLKDGASVTILRLFKKDPEHCPRPSSEHAVLRMDAAAYDRFAKDPAKFVNDFEVFSCTVREGALEKGERKSGPPPAASPKSQGGDPEILVSHDPDCGGLWYEGVSQQ